MPHTTGPWHARENDSGQDTFIWNSDESKYIGLASCEDVPFAEREANARLLAAAPVLLAACKDAVRQMHYHLLGASPWGGAVIEKLEAAVALTEPQAPVQS